MVHNNYFEYYSFNISTVDQKQFSAAKVAQLAEKEETITRSVDPPPIVEVPALCCLLLFLKFWKSFLNRCPTEGRRFSLISRFG